MASCGPVVDVISCSCDLLLSPIHISLLNVWLLPEWPLRRTLAAWLRISREAWSWPRRGRQQSQQHNFTYSKAGLNYEENYR